MLIGERYRVLERLGTGGMATVLLAEDERLGRRVALKRLHMGFAPEVGERFKREAKLGASLSHPNVVGVYDVVSHDDQVVLVMEYVDGRTLAEVLADGALERGRAMALLRPLALALDHAHEQGVIHRDVKPANVLVGDDGTVKLADLGIATGVEHTSVTATGTALGTAAYMAPEQFEGRRATAAADVYALAAVAFEMLSGRKARTGNTPMEVVHRIATEGAPYLRDAWPDAPTETVEVLCAALSSDPEERPPSAGELVRRLEHSLKLAPPPLREPKRARLVVAPTTELPLTDDGAAEPSTVPLADTAQAPESTTTAASPVAAKDPPASTAGKPAEPRPHRRRAAAIAAIGLLALLAAAIVVVALKTFGGGSKPKASNQPQAAPRRPAAAAHPPPERVARAFYEHAAADRYAAAWKLAGRGFRDQLGGFDAFRSQFGTLKSIRFDRAETTAKAGNRATVAIATTATHTNRVDSCRGDVSLSRASRTRPWLIERIGVDCG